MNTNRLIAPKNLVINFQPSPKQMLVWKALQPECPECGGKVEQILKGYDTNGNEIYIPTCKKCGNDNIPQTILCGGAAGGGKMLLLDSNVVTPFGLRKLRDIKVGDIITSATTGGMQRVIWLHPIEEHEFYRVSFVDGTYTDCSEGHLWQIHQSGKRSKRLKKYGEEYRDEVMATKTMYQWMENKKMGMYKGRYLIIPLCEPVQFTSPKSLTVDKPIHPYILGAILGDGCITDSVISKGVVGFTSMDQEIVDRFTELGYDMSKYNTKFGSKAKYYSIYSTDLVEQFQFLGLAGHSAIDKFIPLSYKFATIEERKQLMQGLMDTDGYVDSRGHMSYTTISKQLAEDVAFIVRSLGGKATIKEDEAGYKDKHGEFVQCNNAYTVYIMTKMDPELVHITRKKKLCKYEFNGGASERGKRITDIQPIGRKMGRCITVSEPCGLYLTDDFTVTHNSYLASCWLISSCIRYGGVRMFVARTTLKSIRESTWKTIKQVLVSWGLKQDMHWKENNVLGYIEFWNGSTISMVDLAPSQIDPEYQRLGSSEYSGGYIEEAGEVDEKGAEVLMSRVRYMVYETTVVPKVLLGSNPSLNWIKKRFVCDEDGNDIVRARGDFFYPFLVKDNPDKNFRMGYMQRLMNIKDPATRERLLNGNWLWVDGNDAAAYWSFDGNKHLALNVKERYYDPLRPLILALDFNVLPYMSCLVLQFDYEAKVVYVLEEILGKPEDKVNNTPAMSRKIARKYLSESHLGGLVLTGDPAGLARSTQTEEGVNNFTILTQVLQQSGINVRTKLLNKQPSQVQRLEFINGIFEGYDGWEILIDMSCSKFKEDLIYQRKNPDGTKEKKKVNDAKLKTKYEKYGHLSDCFDYALCYFLSDEYAKFRRSNENVSVVTTVSSDPYVTFDW